MDGAKYSKFGFHFEHDQFVLILVFRSSSKSQQQRICLTAYASLSVPFQRFLRKLRGTYADGGEYIVVTDFDLLEHGCQSAINEMNKCYQMLIQIIQILNKIVMNIKSYSSLAIILSLLLTLATCSLSVYNLQALGSKNDPALLNISYSIANFGFAPYGKTIIARLMTSPNFSKECVIDPSQHANFQNSFLLIPRGECHFVTKALNAQSLGAQMAIIMDDKDHQKLVIMADNDYGYKVKIPSIFINHKDGERLKELIQQNPQNSVMMKVTFDNKKTEKVTVAFWLQAHNRHTYRLVEDFRKYYPLIKDNIIFELVYSNIDCEAICRKEDCYFDGAYCAKNLIHQQSATGQLILDQQIREEIAFKLYPDAWWMYMKRFDQKCSAISEFKQCGAQVMKENGIDFAKVQTEFSQSFSKQQNTYLKKNRVILTQSGVTKFPSVTLNSVKVKGSLYAEFIFDDICNTLLNPPDSCTKYVQTETHISEVTSKWSTLLFVIVLGVLIFSFIFIVYRRYMKKKISTEMQSRVDDMVSKYIEFYSQRSGNK